MENKVAKYLSITKCAWLALTIFLVVFCGPVKKLIEMRIDGNTSSSQTVDKKLRTWYREKHDIASYVYTVAHQQSPDTNLIVLFAATLFSFFLLLRKDNLFRSQYIPSSDVVGIPLYLHINKLQV